MRLLVCLCVLAAAGCNDDRPRGGDAGPLSDAALPDAGPRDAGPRDAGPPDSGPPDAGWPSGTTCPPGYACPDGARFEASGSTGQCIFDVEPPPGAEPYCDFFDDGYIGFYWRLPAAPYTCPPESRYAPNAELGFCLYEDFPVPAGARARCNELAAGRLGFSWVCP